MQSERERLQARHFRWAGLDRHGASRLAMTTHRFRFNRHGLEHALCPIWKHIVSKSSGKSDSGTYHGLGGAISVMTGKKGSLQQLADRFFAFLAEPPRMPTQTRTPLLDRICVFFIAIDWIYFGSLHFAMHAATRAMMPPWLPFPDLLVVLTGIAEVTTGILVCYPRMRRASAVASLTLLVLLIPAVVHILSDPNALPWPQADWRAQAWRLLGVPHNILLGICSVHLLQKPYPDPWDDGRRGRRTTRQGQTGGDGAVLFVAAILMLCNAAGFLAILLGVRTHLGTAAMWMMMCLAVGGLVGFLFAVPRINDKARHADLLVPNRNIEAISDWLSKIIVGLGLINFNEIAAGANARATILGKNLQVDQSFALAMILYFSVAGLLEGYLLTRIFIQRHFVDAIRAGGGVAHQTGA